MRAVALLVLLAACDASTTPDGDTDVGESDVPTGPPDPSTYDCRATSVPERRSPIPIACATDVACTERLVAGHRGAGGDMGVLAPEDTVAAVRAAIAWGVDYVETDPRPSKDGVLVNVHDTDVSRVTTGTGEVADLTVAELKALTMKTDRYAGEFGCERIATFAEILEAAVGRVHVLVDANKTDRVDLLVQDIVDADALAWAIFDTSSVDKIDAALAIEPRLLTMLRVATTDELDAQVAHFAAHPPVLIEIEANHPELIQPVLDAGHRPFTDVFTTDIGAQLTDDLSGYLELYDAGLLVEQTDRPDLVLRALGR